MRKYLVIDEHLNGDGDQWTKAHDTLEAANAQAKSEWNYLTTSERKDRHVFVGVVEDSNKYLMDEAFSDEGIDFTLWHSVDVPAGAFDSNVK